MIEAERRHLALRTLILLFIVLAGFYWLGNGATSFYDRDEPRFAQPAKEFLFAKSWKDWIVPHFNGEPFFHKPPLSYWQMSLAYTLFGVNEFSARLFSAFWTAMTAVIFASWLAKRYSNTVGLVTAMAFSTSLIVIIEAKLATADATLGLFSALAVLGIWEVYRGSVSRVWKLILWVAVGLGILCKGPTIFIILVGLVGTLLLLDKNRRWVLSTGFWWGIPLALVIGLPWYFLANLYGEGGVVSRFVVYDLFARVARPLESHRGFPGFYVLTSLIDAWPWSAFLIPVFGYAWRNKKDPTIKFLLAWLIGPTLILEVVQTKMIHYWITILPAYAILLAMAVDHWIQDPEDAFWRRWSPKVVFALCSVWLMILAGAMVGYYTIFKTLPIGLFVLAGIIIVCVVGMAMIWRGKNLSYSVLGVFMTTVLIVATLSALVLPGLEPYKLGRQLARAMKTMGNDQTTYALIRWQEPSTVFYLNPGNKPVQIVGADAFSSILKQPNTLIGISPKGYGELSPDDVKQTRFHVLDGFDYTRGRRSKIYIAGSAVRDSR